MNLVKKVTKSGLKSCPKSRVFNSREKYGRTPQNRCPDNLARIIWEQSSAGFRQMWRFFLKNVKQYNISDLVSDIIRKTDQKIGFLINLVKKVTKFYIKLDTKTYQIWSEKPPKEGFSYFFL